MSMDVERQITVYLQFYNAVLRDFFTGREEKQYQVVVTAAAKDFTGLVPCL